MNPTVRPAPSERSTENQLYSELSPLCATAPEQAEFFGTMLPCWLRPSRQHRKVRLPGVISAPCADAGGALSVAATRPAIRIATAANTVVALLRVIVPSFLRLGALPVV